MATKSGAAFSKPLVVECDNELCGNYHVPIEVEPERWTQGLLDHFEATDGLSVPKGAKVGDIYHHWTGVVCGGTTPTGPCGKQLHTP